MSEGDRWYVLALAAACRILPIVHLTLYPLIPTTAV